MLKKLAVYKDMRYDYETVLEVPLEGYARLSEIVEVDFPEISKEESVRLQLDELQRLEDEARDKLRKALADIKWKREALLCLEAPTSDRGE